MFFVRSLYSVFRHRKHGLITTDYFISQYSVRVPCCIASPDITLCRQPMKLRNAPPTEIINFRLCKVIASGLNLVESNLVATTL